MIFFFNFITPENTVFSLIRHFYKERIVGPHINFIIVHFLFTSKVTIKIIKPCICF